MRCAAVIVATLVATVTCQLHGDTGAPPAPVSPMGPQGPHGSQGSTVALDVASTSSAMTDASPPVTSGASMVTDTMETTSQSDNSTDAPTSPAAESTTAAQAVVTSTAAPATTPASPQGYLPDIDEIISVFKALAQSTYFQKLGYEDQILVLELTSGGEAGKINEVLDSLGHERFLNFLHNIPLRYFDDLMRFVLASIERENNMVAAAS